MKKMCFRCWYATEAQHVYSDATNAQPIKYDVLARKACHGGTRAWICLCPHCLLSQAAQQCCNDFQSFQCTCCEANSKTLLQSGSMQFATARESMKSPLAKKLFQIDGVTNVFFGSDFVTVTKSDDYTWNVVKPDIFAGIMDHFTSGTPSVSCSIHLSYVHTAAPPCKLHFCPHTIRRLHLLQSLLCHKSPRNCDFSRRSADHRC